ncbi:N-acetyltransferase [Bacillus sp. J14TS2]|uniref:GNAT family N-acetyltransferase n=1 Tax=Bacillus sp. J14TS2 TaxID=2807188 RepID=UPI001B2CB819|nr:GNAT family N-acetyltransferase [Bacillus sp. J14TS2]GIN74911.1 N-acetyltransferase [Bacillus sp. J14TS2]
MKTNDVSIRKMKHTDFQLMAQWLSTKEVLEFYGDVNAPFTLQQVKDKYEPRVNGAIPIIPYIVELDNMPIGFIQQYKLSKEEQEKLDYPAHFNIYGMDQFIGIPSLYNKGIGAIMVRLMLDYIAHHTDAEIILLDPAVSNIRAIRCYEKCGFMKVKKINDEANWLMEYRRR